ncbi:MAG: phosphatase PAP2 family protein [Candidatus Omnitrophica bacterium]|nr:phosphatase PAP2 family protein [Candidatus Omnitrophota bacterium]
MMTGPPGSGQRCGRKKMRFYKKPEKHFGSKFLLSVNAALEGVVHTLQSERNMRIHFAIAFLVLIAGIYLNLSPEQFMILCFAVTFVLVAEMFNTAIEHLTDHVSDEFHPTVKIIKDVSAGAVFVSAVNASITGYLLFAKRIAGGMRGLLRIKQSPWHITLITLLVVIGVVILIKVIRKEKFLLKGGMPSGHSAVAFAVWVVISLLTMNPLVSILVFFLVLIIAKSRMTNGVHSLWEVIAGSLIGALVALLIFQMLS